MAKLNQIIAVCDGKKSRTIASLTEIHHKVQKKGLLEGIARTYHPKDEENGEKLPPESNRVQYTVKQAIEEAVVILSDLFDAVATQDYANCEARADVVVEGKALLTKVPVTHLLFLEKKLVDLHTFVDKLPTLDPGKEWSWNEAGGAYATPVQETVRSKKVKRAFEASPATDKHPAQVMVFDEDVQVGTWSKIDYSGAIQETRRKELLDRVRKLQEAVKMAREEANSIEVKDQHVADPVFKYLFS